MSINDWASIIGLVLASVSLGWNILNEIRKAPKAKVHAMIAGIIQPGSRIHDDKDYLSISIANIGSRPIRINGVGFTGYKWWWHPFKKKHFVIIPKQVPIYLKDGEEHTEIFEYTLKDFTYLLSNNIQNISVHDSGGRIHYMPRLKFLNFKKSVRKHVKKAPGKSHTHTAYRTSGGEALGR